MCDDFLNYSSQPRLVVSLNNSITVGSYRYEALLNSELASSRLTSAASVSQMAAYMP